ncbi:MAG: hypothetical protein ACTHNP_11410 [Solirubrobacterales bacterium]
MALALTGAILSLLLMPIPKDAKGDPDLPAVALQQVDLYRLEMALLVFYSELLLVTPAFSGLIWGRLPTEISMRGAKFAEDSDRSADSNRAAVKRLERATGKLDDELKIASFEIKRLKEISRRDSTQPEVESER